MKNKITLLNSISALLVQITSIISGFIVPKILLSYFGSSVNGLVSSISQFLSYIALVEGGVTGVLYANLYKPLVNNDKNQISSIVVTAKRFYNKIGLLFILYSVVIAVIYPLYINKDFGFLYVFSLTLILSSCLLIQYMFSLTLRTLLTADKKLYIISFTQIFITIANVLLVYISVKIFPNIHFLKAISGCLYILQPIIYGKYVKKHYNIDWNAKFDNSLLAERWNGFAINVAAFIHTSTDITILTLFSNLQTVSIYSVYTLVTGGLSKLVQSITSGLNPTVGHAFARGNSKELHEKLDLYEYLVFFIVGYLFSLAALLITPFVMLYTNNIVDADYFQPLFGYLIVLSEALYLIKFPHLNLAYSANKFKEITIPAYIEAVINIVVSIILVNNIGLIGVAIGTICAMIYRLIFHVYYTSKIFPGRKQSIFYKKFGIIIVATCIGIILCSLFPCVEYTVSSWLFCASAYSLIILLVYFLTSILYFKKELGFLIRYIKKR